MTGAAQTRRTRWPKVAVVTLPALLGICLLRLPALEQLSFDATFLPRLGAPARLSGPLVSQCLILGIDSATKRLLGVQEHEPISRQHHTELLDRLREDGARLVVFDLIFEQPRSEVDGEFAAAMTRHGNVILAAGCDFTNERAGANVQVNSASFVPVSPVLQAAAAGLGNIGNGLRYKTKAEARQHVWRQPPLATNGCESLPVVAARRLGLGTAAFQGSHRWWLNYYGSEKSIPTLSYANALVQEKSFFKDKTVLVGDTTPGGNDRWRTPLTRWGTGDMPGSEILATALLNLARGDALQRWAAGAELMLVAGAGVLLGWGALRWRRARFLVLSGVMMAIVPVLAVASANEAGRWCNWAVLSCVQTPVALALNWLWHRPARLLSPVELAPKEVGVRIPGHHLHAVIGRGGFGEVWLAQNELLGTFRAVKLVHRSRTGDSRHFDYELRGVKLYEPISRQHPGLVPILQVGQAENGDYFYYIMELADDQSPAEAFDVARYAPRTLATDLLAAARRQAAVERCLSIPAAIELGAELAAALAFLHSRNVVHRDLKPANVVFVGAKPKLGDPGLAAEADRSQPSQPGTLEYMDPATHGQPVGDIFSLAKVLAHATGVTLGRKESAGPFPGNEVNCPPMSALPGPAGDVELVRQFSAVLTRACGPAESRFPSATEFREALLSIGTNA